jgi:hypothetical protein
MSSSSSRDSRSSYSSSDSSRSYDSSSSTSDSSSSSPSSRSHRDRRRDRGKGSSKSSRNKAASPARKRRKEAPRDGDSDGDERQANKAAAPRRTEGGKAASRDKSGSKEAKGKPDDGGEGTPSKSRPRSDKDKEKDKEKEKRKDKETDGKGDKSASSSAAAGAGHAADEAKRSRRDRERERAQQAKAEEDEQRVAEFVDEHRGKDMPLSPEAALALLAYERAVKARGGLIKQHAAARPKAAADAEPAAAAGSEPVAAAPALSARSLTDALVDRIQSLWAQGAAAAGNGGNGDGEEVLVSAQAVASPAAPSVPASALPALTLPVPLPLPCDPDMEPVLGVYPYELDYLLALTDRLVRGCNKSGRPSPYLARLMVLKGFPPSSLGIKTHLIRAVSFLAAQQAKAAFEAHLRDLRIAVTASLPQQPQQQPPVGSSTTPAADDAQGWYTMDEATADLVFAVIDSFREMCLQEKIYRRSVKHRQWQEMGMKLQRTTHPDFEVAEVLSVTFLPCLANASPPVPLPPATLAIRPETGESDSANAAAAGASTASAHAADSLFRLVPALTRDVFPAGAITPQRLDALYTEGLTKRGRKPDQLAASTTGTEAVDAAGTGSAPSVPGTEAQPLASGLVAEGADANADDVIVLEEPGDDEGRFLVRARNGIIERLDTDTGTRTIMCTDRGQVAACFDDPPPFRLPNFLSPHSRTILEEIAKEQSKAPQSKH